ncbi:50S ribosomal protein L33 [candidate division NPL-UPA2 bacterium Unc8]|uniref:Large ribosomal subunit protein bL33 n=1 Tax=candidate division NPL-UPA2 bacterium Unc8 TaxID=1980939 RepID=A0A399FV89_UNCN2|nr:MAG: 50S ribosomal protein L33 [candidate division NPL-UPA2 bacterium Unc8]
MQEIAILACVECRRRNYSVGKRKKQNPGRLELRKYCRFCRKHVVHKETK